MEWLILYHLPVEDRWGDIEFSSDIGLFDTSEFDDMQCHSRLIIKRVL